MCYKILNDKKLTLSLGVKSRHNSGNATRCQTQIARLLSQAHMLKINRDHPARLVSSNRENFRILTGRRYDTFSLRGGHYIRGASSAFGSADNT